MSWGDWVGRFEGGGSSGWVAVRENPKPKAREFPPQWPGTSLSLTYLMLSLQTFWLNI